MRRKDRGYGMKDWEYNKRDVLYDIEDAKSEHKIRYMGQWIEDGGCGIEDMIQDI